ncbi:MAG: M48 family metallopeptidase [Chromatiales bacterium]|nr:M48 family metallopeptidase [Chromatiales bacterium]
MITTLPVALRGLLLPLLVAFVTVSSGLGATQVARAADNLPSIGSPSDTLLSREREQQIGRAIFRNLRDTERVMTDPEVQEYMQDLGQRLAANAQEGGFQFTFFMVEDSAINAFALPGGYIGIHSGLLLATRTESELAGVVAHEIAHVTQRHISRAVFANQRASILTMAALLGAILVGAAAGDANVIQAGVLGAQSASIQQQINFTRANEYEADRVGVSILAAAGFDPMGMPNFFETLARQSGPLAAQAPEFLRTHPVTVNRISETRARAASYAVDPRPETTSYALTRARVRVLTSSTPERSLAFFSNQYEESGGADLGAAYGLALSYMAMGRPAEALPLFERLKDEHQAVIPFHTGVAQARLALGRTDEGMAVFELATALFPRNVPLTIRYAEALMQHGDARLAHRILLDLLHNVRPTPEQVRLIAMAASAAGDTADAHYYMSEYHLLKGDLRMAADQLRLALSMPELDGVQRARFRSRLDQVMEFLPRDAQAVGN